MNVKTSENVLYKTSIPILRDPWGFDVLALACELAEDFNISIHAWIPLRTNISEWQQVDINGKRSLIFNFALPEAQSHIYSIINELLNYPIKGIHLDYIRYEGKNYGFDDYSVKAFINKTGINPRENPDNPQWIEWRKRQVSNIVNQTKIIVKNHDLKLQLSVACFTHPENVLQDWFNWQKQDLIDFACPMNYEKDPIIFENNIKYMLSQGISNGSKIQLQILLQSLLEAEEIRADLYKASLRILELKKDEQIVKEYAGTFDATIGLKPENRVLSGKKIQANLEVRNLSAMLQRIMIYVAWLPTSGIPFKSQKEEIVLAPFDNIVRVYTHRPEASGSHTVRITLFKEKKKWLR